MDMMLNGLVQTAKLKAASFRDCYPSFPQHWRSSINPVAVPTFLIESTNQGSMLVSWTGKTHNDNQDERDCIYISSRLLRGNGFDEGELVFVKQVPLPSPCVSVTMMMKSMQEWKELVMNMDIAQEAFLVQIRVLQLYQKVPLWLEGGTVVYFEVQTMVPTATRGLLQLNTSVEVVPPPGDQDEVSPLTLTACHKSERDIERKHIDINAKEIIDLLNYLYPICQYKLYIKKECVIYMKAIPYLLPHKMRSTLSILFEYHPSLIIVSKKYFKNSVFSGLKFFPAQIQIIEKNTPENVIQNNDDLFVVVMMWETLKKSLNYLDEVVINEIDQLLNCRRCIVPSLTAKTLSISCDSLVCLSPGKQLERYDQIEVEVFPKCSINSKDAKNIPFTLKFVFTEVCAICPIIIKHSVAMNLGNQEHDEVIISTRNKKLLYLDSMSLPLLNVNLIKKCNLVPPTVLKKNVQNFLCDDSLVKELTRHVMDDLYHFNSHHTAPRFILLEGDKGSGKTSVVRAVKSALQQSPYFINIETIELKLLKGKKIESIKKIFMSTLKHAVDYQPSLLILDDLDFLCPTPSEIEPNKGPMHDYITQACCMVKNLLHQIMENSKPISVDETGVFISSVVTCHSRDSLHSYLSSPTGKHLFPKSICIPKLEHEEKYSLLSKFLTESFRNHVDNKQFSQRVETGGLCTFGKQLMLSKCENFTLQDLTSLGKRIFEAALQRWSIESSGWIEASAVKQQSFCDEDLRKALHGFVPAATKVLNLPLNIPKKNKIGGMSLAREALEEMVLWPVRYPHLFSQTSLKLRSGILLYGPPGCGKTLLASSFGADLDFNFITIKGPELLSKYIGQSEKAVREIFERAQNARPCVLFFDEFDSIAPRRGHDSTGVTDRVVNQLLTQIDGVEGLMGVYLIAATSRPDLLDPALLRPGRFDKSIYCALPDDHDRLEILHQLGTSLNFEESIDWLDICSKTFGFSGADLQSLLSTAQIVAARESLGNSLYSGISNDDVAKGPPALPGRASSSNDYLHNYTDDAKGLLCSSEIGRLSCDASLMIYKRHITEALNEVRPSLSMSDRLRYEALKEHFTTSKKKKLFDAITPGSRETLA